MAVSHLKSNTVADFTGTVTVLNSAGAATTVAATDLVRPSDWNSAHNQYVTVSGNTAGTSAGSGTNLVYGGSNAVTVNLSTAAGGGQTLWIDAPAGGGAAVPRYAAFVGEDYKQVQALITNITVLTQRPLFFPFDVGGVMSANEIHWTMSRSTSGSNHFTVHAGIYSYSNSTRIDLISSGSYSFSNTATASVSGIKAFEVPCPLTSFSDGGYVLGMIFSATATASMNYSFMGGTTANPANVNVVITGADAYHTYTSHPTIPFWGRFTTTTGGLPASVGMSNVIGGFTGASLPMPVHFYIVNHY